MAGFMDEEINGIDDPNNKRTAAARFILLVVCGKSDCEITKEENENEI
jgi:hypothetical protein